MTGEQDRLEAASTRLAELFDVALMDLDGVVYVGPDAVPEVPEALAQARSAGLQLAFVTNNASRTPQQVAEHLTRLGIDAAPDEVVTSSQAAARYLAERLPADSPVLILGTEALAESVAERGLTPVKHAGSGNDRALAVVQGYSPDMDWRTLAEGAVAINAGALWVATNADPTVPSARGPLPGNGSLVAALQRATRRDPTVTGKPEPTMHDETVLRTGAKRPVVVGDRLDTDIEGANNVGCASLLVLSGVTTVADLLAAPRHLRPTYVAATAAGLLTTHPETDVDEQGARCGQWFARAESGRLLLGLRSSDGPAAAGGAVSGVGNAPVAHSPVPLGPTAGRLDADHLDAVRALCGAAWHSSRDPDDRVTPQLCGADDDGVLALGELGLPVG